MAEEPNADGLVPIMIRVPLEIKEQFFESARVVGRRPSVLARELVTAYVENRCTLAPPTDPLYEDKS